MVELVLNEARNLTNLVSYLKLFLSICLNKNPLVGPHIFVGEKKTK